MEQTLSVVGEPYCAYSEAFMRPIDSANVEHFDDRKKGTDEDDYWNWYAVLGHMNFRKPEIAKHLPVLAPHSPLVCTRIQYDDGQFRPTNTDDREAANLIELLGWNDPTLANYRRKHIERMRFNRELFQSDEEFVAFMHMNPENLSFITALEAELDMKLS